MHLQFYDAIQTTQDWEVWRKSVEQLLTRVDSTSPHQVKSKDNNKKKKNN